MLENICLEESKENRIILLRCILRSVFAGTTGVAGEGVAGGGICAAATGHQASTRWREMIILNKENLSTLIKFETTEPTT